MSSTNKYFATCSKGVEDLVYKELEQLQIPGLKLHTGGVSFTGELQDAYKACLWVRVASRILFQLKQFEISSDDDLYDEIKAIKWAEHFTEDNTLAIDCFSSHSVVTNSHYATLRVKDAIVDQFVESMGFRPSIQRDNPDIRLNVYLSDQQCLLYLDLSGEALHKRGYRQTAGVAPLRETLAASMLYRAKWDTFFTKGLPFCDPMCGSGTLLIEAAMMAADIAPGLLREKFGFSNWKHFDAAQWEIILDEAYKRKQKGQYSLPLIFGSDSSEQVVAFAKNNIKLAGLSSLIKVSVQDATDNLKPLDNIKAETEANAASEPTATSKSTATSKPTDTADMDALGLIVTNPPYGKRIGQTQLLRTLYYRFGKQLKANFDGWTAVIITSEQELAKSLGLRAFRKNTLYNGAIISILYQYRIKAFAKNYANDAERETAERQRAERNKPERQKPELKKTGTANPSIYTKDKNADIIETHTSVQVSEHASMFINRLKKNYKHLKKWARKNNVSCYRVYDADIPQYAVAIDKYDNWIHVQEYQAPKTVDKNRAFQRINDVIDVVADVLETKQEYVVLKVRKRQQGSSQYQKQDEKKRKISVHENNLKFLINVYDYIDTGLFLDHRFTRMLIKQLANKRSFLNLFAYTGTVSVCAAAGGAKTTTTVDMSNTYLNWAQENMSVNGYVNSNVSSKANTYEASVYKTSIYKTSTYKAGAYTKNTTSDKHQFIRADCLEWIRLAIENKQKYQLIFVDPPTFSNSKKMSTIFDIKQDHAALLDGCLALLSDDGQIIFSTNAKGFKLDKDISDDCLVKEITDMTVTEDFRRKPLHRCWCLVKRESAFSNVRFIKP